VQQTRREQAVEEMRLAKQAAEEERLRKLRDHDAKLARMKAGSSQRSGSIGQQQNPAPVRTQLQAGIGD
jgi:hypothetical protein